MKPDDLSAETWDAVFENFRSQLGATNAQVAAAIRETANYLSLLGEHPIDVQRLLGLMLRQADNSLVNATLASTDSAYVPAPGMPLVFSSYYQQPISSRLEAGTLGRGWSSTLDAWQKTTFSATDVNGSTVRPGSVRWAEWGDLSKIPAIASITVHTPSGSRVFRDRDPSGFWDYPVSWWGILSGRAELRSDDGATVTPIGLQGGTFLYSTSVRFIGIRLREPDGTTYFFYGNYDSDSYHLSGNDALTAVMDANGNGIMASRDADGRITRLSRFQGDPSAPGDPSESLVFEYNDFNRVTRLTDPAGQVTTFAYDALGEHLLSEAGPYGTTSYTYSTAESGPVQHALTSVAYPDGSHAFFDYDDRGRLIGQYGDGGAEALNISYVGPGEVIFTDALSSETRLFFNSRGALAQVQDPLGRISRFEYDADGNLVQQISPEGIAYRYGYDDHGNVTKRSDPLGNTIRMVSDPNVGPGFRTLLSVTNPLGVETTFLYDERGNLSRIVRFGGSSEQFTYDSQGNVTQWTNRRGEPIRYAYNQQGQVIREEYADGSSTLYTYDARGNMLTATDAAGTTNMEYDSADRMTKIIYPNGRFLEYTYDAGGRRARMTDQTGFTVNYAYDAIGRLSALTDGQGVPMVNYAYDAAGRLQRKDMGNGTYTTYEYDAAGQLLHLVNYAPNGSVNSINSRFDYTYDALGRRDTMTTLEGTWHYGYDATGQLISVTTPAGRTIEYEYDANGNRKVVRDSGVDVQYVTNQLDQYTRVGSVFYSYDADGNMIGKVDGNQTWTYTYDVHNRLVGVTGPDGTWTYEYDVFGNRVASSHNGQRTEYLLDPTGFVDVVAEYDGSGGLIARYTQGLGLTSRIDPTGASSYYDFDAIGSTAGLTGVVGGYVNQYTTLPFGEVVSATETVPNPFQFVGQWGVIREGNGLDFMRARFYEEGTGRFLSDDPLGIGGGNVNLLAYVMNHPTGLVDPSGLQYGYSPIYDRIKNDLPDEDKYGVIKPDVTDEERRRSEETQERWREIGPKDPTENPDRYIDPFPKYFIPQIVEIIIKHPWILPILPLLLLPGDTVDKKTMSFVRSGDPNDKTGPVGAGEEHYVLPGSTMPYTIYYENDPEIATAPRR